MRVAETRQRSASKAANRARRIALIGLRGAGKSTLGDGACRRGSVRRSSRSTG